MGEGTGVRVKNKERRICLSAGMLSLEEGESAKCSKR
jgi:hypothetical protein